MDGSTAGQDTEAHCQWVRAFDAYSKFDSVSPQQLKAVWAQSTKDLDICSLPVTHSTRKFDPKPETNWMPDRHPENIPSPHQRHTQDNEWNNVANDCHNCCGFNLLNSV